jgi:hypothetical protein
MNILKIADGVTGLFPRKIMVTVVDEVSGVVIGSYKAGKESLPEVFDKPMAIELNGVLWRVVKAEYASGRRLGLWVQEEGYFRSHNKKWMVPTVSQKPALGGMRMANDFLIEIGLEEWRQIEFLPAAMQGVVEEEMRLIEKAAGNGGLLGYEIVHVRDNIENPLLEIPFHEFYQFVEGREKGSIELEKMDGILLDGFFIRSNEYLYYGIVENKQIRQLCLEKFDSMDDEATNVITMYNLMMVDWCRGRII